MITSWVVGYPIDLQVSKLSTPKAVTCPESENKLGTVRTETQLPSPSPTFFTF